MVREGYKQTEIGVIPQAWAVARLSSQLKSNPQYGLNAPAVSYQPRLPVYIRITDISEDGSFRPNTVVCVNHHSSNEYFLEDGDIVFARTGASVGKSYCYNVNDGRLVYAGFLIKIQPDQDRLLVRFLSQYVKTKAYWSWVQVMSMRSGQPGINGNEYGQLLIPMPKIEEQQAIAEALSDVDGLIDGLEKLIAKKQAIKTATMQQLLTGKTRLPGFGEGKGYKQTELGEIPEDWEVRYLSEVVSNIIDYRGRTPKKIGMEWGGGDIVALSAANVKMGYIDLEEECYLGSDALYKKWMTNGDPRKNDIVITMEAPLGNVALIPDDRRYILSQRTILLQFNEDIAVNEFVYHQFKSIWFQKYLKDNSTGSTAQGIKRTRLEKLAMPIAPLAEQQAIAEALSDMDKELESHQTRLNKKTKSIKQGMMQELLTGRTRLI